MGDLGLSEVTRAAHLHVHSAYSFLDGAGQPHALVASAAQKGIGTVALTDWHRVSGLVQFLSAAESAGIRAIAGAAVQLEGIGELVLLAPDATAYRALTAVLTAAHATEGRRPDSPRVRFEHLMEHGAGLVALTGGRRGVVVETLRRHGWRALEPLLDRLLAIFSRGRGDAETSRLFIELAANRLPGDRQLFQGLRDLGASRGIPLVASADVHYPERRDFPLYDLLTCIRLGIPIESVAAERRLNAENDLKTWEEMTEILREWPEAIAGAEVLGERLEPPRLLGRSRLPQFPTPQGESPDTFLRQLVERGARKRYGSTVAAVWPRIRHELAIIRDLGYAGYFLVVWDVARYAREAGIRSAGRGSAADSVVAYCLGITAVDAFRRGLLFERFMSRERAEVPDIDIDFDARYRDRVAAYVEARYGREQVARVATYQTYRRRLAVREIGKVMGFPPEELDALAHALPERRLGDILTRWEAIPELRERTEERLRRVIEWAALAEGLPRHLGTHVGGVVVSQDPLGEVSPWEFSAKGQRILQFDKRDVEALGLMKLDLLSLRIFSAMETAVATIHRETPGFDETAVPLDDAATFARLQQGEAVGTFQLESPAQRALAVRLKPDCQEDLVASLALIRPGPIKGNMVDPYVARRRGREPVTYLHPALEPILSKTYGVVLFQEQVIAIASVLAGFTPGEADALRRVMTHGRSVQEMERIGDHFKAKAQENGIAAEVAEAVFQQMVGYASYGFNEAHAVAFADTSYRTAYLLEHYPHAFFTGLLNAEPLGYYPVDVLLVEARRRGIEIAPIDVNQSQAETHLDADRRIRLGLRFVMGWGAALAEQVAQGAPYERPSEVLKRNAIDRDQLLTLIRIGGFDALGPDRDAWMSEVEQATPLGLSVSLPTFPPWSRLKKVLTEYQYLGFGQTEQFLAPFRQCLMEQGFRTAQEVRDSAPETWVRMVGTMIRPHRPPTRSGKIVVFFSLLDETGMVEAHLPEYGYQRYGRWLFGKVSPIIAVQGKRTSSGLAVRSLWPWEFQRFAGLVPEKS